MSFPPLASPHPQVFRYWDACRGARAMPARADLDPVAMKAFLPHLMLIDVMPDHFRYRLVGTQVVQDFGRDDTGNVLGQHVTRMPFSADIAGATGIFARVRDSAAPIFTTGHHQTPAGVTHSVSRLLLPLGQDGRVNMILLSRLARHPRRLGGQVTWDPSAQAAQSEIFDVASEAEVRALADRREAQSDGIEVDRGFPSARPR